MFTLTYNNHLRYTYLSGQHRRQGPLDQCTLTIGRDQNELSFRDNLFRNAELLAASVAGREIVIQLSGGSDSELVTRVFREAEIPFTPLIVEYEHGLNRHDTFHAHRLCRELGLKPRVHKLNLSKFITSGEAFEVGLQFQTTSLQMQALLSTCFLFPNGLTIHCDEIEIKRVVTPDLDDITTPRETWFIRKLEDQDTSWHKFYQLTGIRVNNNFFTYTSETIYSFFKLPLVRWLVLGDEKGDSRKLSYFSTKHDIYREAGFKITANIKMTGTERFEPSNSFLKMRLIQHDPTLGSMTSFYTPASEFL